MYKKSVFDEVFALAYYGNGGWDWNIAYNLPIHIRRYCIKLIRIEKEKEQEQIKNQNVDKNVDAAPKIPKSVYKALNVDGETGRRLPKN